MALLSKTAHKKQKLFNLLSGRSCVLLSEFMNPDDNEYYLFVQEQHIISQNSEAFLNSRIVGRISHTPEINVELSTPHPTLT